MTESRIAFDLDTICALAANMRENALTAIEITVGDVRLLMHRAAAAAPAPVHVPVQAAAPASGPQAAASVTDMPAAEPSPTANAVTSPMVGIAYLAPEPGATPFITLGATVVAGQTILLIEAMKTFNQIKAPHAGTVTRILVASGDPVEYAQPLLVIE